MILMLYRVELEIFERFPHFYRGCVVARGIDNSRADGYPTQLLRQQEERIRAEIGDPSAHPRLAAWQNAYRDFGADPAKHTPSIVFLVQRICQGKSIASISPVVDLFNWISLKHLLPAGGDCVDELAGDLTLGLARGTEAFASLRKPHSVENPEPGEVIYVNRDSNRVLCRRWNWRNAAFSKITRETRCVVLNIDGLTSAVNREEIEEATEALAIRILRSCQGMVSTYYLDRRRPEAEIYKLVV
jgi:DNA/RNA-binding domain of Phe-tRNA-synthetase-like protein